MTNYRSCYNGYYQDLKSQNGHQYRPMVYVIEISNTGRIRKYQQISAITWGVSK
jgi:hypothetical protein